MMELSPGKLWGLRRMADAGGRFKMVAVDQRPPRRATATAALAAIPPPTTARSLARYFSARTGIDSTANT